MILFYFYWVLWVFSIWVNVISVILGLIASGATGIILNKPKSSTKYKFAVVVISIFVFFGVTHVGYILGLMTANVQDEEIEVDLTKVQNTLKTKKIA